jgi:hypothetical protein
MYIFHGDRYNEDLEEFMDRFLQCMKTRDDNLAVEVGPMFRAELVQM